MSRWTKEEHQALVAANAEKFEALKEYPSRLWITPPSDRVTEHLVQLDKAERETDPRGCVPEPIDNRKDVKAFRAIEDAASILKNCAGWALDHQVGLALANLDFVPIRVGTVSDLPAYGEARAAVDKHEHEKAGAAARSNLFEPIVARNVLLQFIRATGSVLPRDVYAQAIEGLEALEFGEQTEIFQPVPTTAKRQLRERRSELKAVAHVEHRKELGIRAAVAQEEVASAFGVTAETLRRWEKPVRESLGQIVVAEAIRRAKYAADVVKASRRGQDGGDLLSIFLPYFDDNALRRDGQSYRKLLASGK